jgi:hypothetical protein
VSDDINHPEHYTNHPTGVECIEIIEEFPHNIAAAMGYLWRCDLKHEDAVTDLRKARWHIDREIYRRRKRQEEAEAATQRWVKPEPSGAADVDL